jgi:hypothetical protein
VDAQHSELELLHLVEAYVRRDPMPPGFKGVVAIGVRSKSEDRWLRIRCADRAEPAFSSERPVDADSTLLVGELEAQSIVRAGTVGEDPQTLFIDGERDLLVRFLKRYVGRQTPLALRISTMGSKRRRDQR